LGNEQVAVEEVVFLSEQLMESCEDDRELAREVIEDFRETTPLRLSRLATAVAAGETVGVRLEAHSLKGSARTIGAEAFAEVAHLLEKAGSSGDLSNVSALLAEAHLRLYALNAALTAYLAKG